MYQRHTLAVLFCLLLIQPTQAAIPIVHNPAKPPTIETLQLHEAWCLDNEEDLSLPLMGIILQAVVDENDHVLLLDRQMAQVLDMSSDGKFIGTLSRMGQGPGELEEPTGIFLRDNGQVGLVQTYPGKVILMDRDGTPSGSFSAQGDIPVFYYVEESAGNLVVGGQIITRGAGDGQNGNRSFLSRYSMEGVLLNTYLENTIMMQNDPPIFNEEGRWFPNQAWSVAADGSVLIATQRDEYRIEWFEPDGQVRRVITRDFKPYIRTKEERKKELDSMRMWGPGGELHPKKTILDTEPVINQIQVLRDGTIWVKSCYAEKDLPEGIQCRYDVFDSGGNLLSEVRIAFKVDREKDYFQMLADGRFLFSRNGRSALDALYSHIEGGDKEEEEIDDDELGIQVILLEPASLK